jgi:hypothetical protein
LIGSTPENSPEASLKGLSPLCVEGRLIGACEQTDRRRKATAIPAHFVSSKAARTEKQQQHGGEARSSIALLPSAYTQSESAML